MIPVHNDEEWLDDGEEDEDADGDGDSALMGLVLPRKWGSLTCMHPYAPLPFKVPSGSL